MYVVICPYCSNVCEINVDGNKKGKSKAYYKCSHCNASVTASKTNYAPLGIPANSNLRKLRVITHNALDKYIAKRGIQKDEAYVQLSKRMNLSMRQTHIALFNNAQCIEALRILKK